MSTDDRSRPIYRVDRFAVPAHGRDEFLGRVAITHAMLRDQDGFVRDLVLERRSGPGAFNFVTLVEWSDREAYERAAARIAALHAETGFDRNEMMSRLGIEADLADYGMLEIRDMDPSSRGRMPAATGSRAAR